MPDTSFTADSRSLAELVLEISHRIARADLLDEQLGIIVEEITRVTDAERGSLFLNDPQTNELYSRVALGGVNRPLLPEGQQRRYRAVVRR